MAQSINLVPQQEKVVQKRSKLVRVSTVLSIGMLVIVALVAAYYFYTVSSLRQDIAQAQDDISVLRTEISKLSRIEISVRNLDRKFTTLKNIYSSTPFYSSLMEELQRRQPESIEIDDFATGEESQVTLSGRGDDYLAVSEFITALTRQETDEASESTESRDYFTNVELKSVSLESQTGRVKYFLTVTINESLLTK